jgi:hypothetical protein
MRQFRILISITFLCLALSAQSKVFSTPEEAVQSYITGVSTGSGEHVNQAFLVSAEIQYYNQDGKLLEYTRDAFAREVNTGNQWDADIKITNMLITGKAANATVDFTWGADGQHGYVDYLNLIHDGESWHITNKVAQYIERK